MKKIVIAAALAASFNLPAFAQSTAAESEAAPQALSGNAGLFSEYRFRGITQTFGRPALQGGIDYAHSSGLYVGNWNSNVSSGAGYPNGNLEMDFYGGYKLSVGEVGLDFGGIYYAYPGSDLNGKAVKNGELYVGASWKFLSAKYYYAVTDYFNARGPNGEKTDGTGYLDISSSFDLGDGWGLNAHVGHLSFRKVANASYTDWKLGVTKDVNGWVFGLSYVDTNANGNCGRGEFYCFSNDIDTTGSQTGSKRMDAGRATAVLSVSRTF